MNKKGFTLVELLAVIALLAILMGIAVPNIISTINNNKRDAFLLDAKRMVSKAEYLISINKEDRNKLKDKPGEESVIYKLDADDLNENDEFQTDADGGSYDETSFVKVTFSNTDNSYKYCICVIGSKRKISNSTSDTCASNYCVDSSLLTSINVVKDR